MKGELVDDHVQEEALPALECGYFIPVAEACARILYSTPMLSKIFVCHILLFSCFGSFAV